MAQQQLYHFNVDCDRPPCPNFPVIPGIQGPPGPEGPPGPTGLPGTAGPTFYVEGAITTTTETGLIVGPAYTTVEDVGIVPTDVFHYPAVGFSTTSAIAPLVTGLHLDPLYEGPESTLYTGISVTPNPTELYPLSLIQLPEPGIYDLTATFDWSLLTIVSGDIAPTGLTNPAELRIYGYDVVVNTDGDNNVVEAGIYNRSLLASTTLAPLTFLGADTTVTVALPETPIDFTHIGVELVVVGLAATVPTVPPVVTFAAGGINRVTFMGQQVQSLA